MKIRCGEREVSTNHCVAIIVSTALAGVVTAAIMAGLIFGGMIAISCWFIAFGGTVGALLGFGVSTFIAIKFFHQSSQPPITLPAIDIEVINNENETVGIDIDILISKINGILELINRRNSNKRLIKKINQEIVNFYEMLYVEDRIFHNVPKLILGNKGQISEVVQGFNNMLTVCRAYKEGTINRKSYIERMMGSIIGASTPITGQTYGMSEFIECVGAISNGWFEPDYQTLPIINGRFMEILKVCCSEVVLGKLQQMDDMEKSPGKYAAQMVIYSMIFLGIWDGITALVEYPKQGSTHMAKQAVSYALTVGILNYIDCFIDLINFANGCGDDVKQKDFQCICDEFKERYSYYNSGIYDVYIAAFAKTLLSFHGQNNAVAEFNNILIHRIDIESWMRRGSDEAGCACVDLNWSDLIELLRQKCDKILQISRMCSLIPIE